jgi:hypothetical protein
VAISGKYKKDLQVINIKGFLCNTISVEDQFKRACEESFEKGYELKDAAIEVYSDGGSKYLMLCGIMYHEKLFVPDN